MLKISASKRPSAETLLNMEYFSDRNFTTMDWKKIEKPPRV